MRLTLVCVGILGVSAGCAAQQQVNADDDDPVNPFIQQRIAEKEAEGRAEGYPDLRTVRDTAPALPAAAVITGERETLRGQASTLAQEVDSVVAATPPSDLTTRAQQLREQIARDRAIMAAEGSLADRLAAERAAAALENSPE